MVLSCALFSSSVLSCKRNECSIGPKYVFPDKQVETFMLSQTIDPFAWNLHIPQCFPFFLVGLIKLVLIRKQSVLFCSLQYIYIFFIKIEVYVQHYIIIFYITMSIQSSMRDITNSISIMLLLSQIYGFCEKLVMLKHEWLGALNNLFSSIGWS